ncbi:response regulator [Pseudoroseomonas rhizosphaerae]|uniref:Response regulator n=1 Tax=Teichococcus rhizosphaerae TaxID=1335062 RepID=A0A2C6XXM4_9PROT|nr:response regulator [Pseudoroseomonas rhizosphaerae]PHK93292.1 response regulator [Pseudoroseomonas rhizosphaerae]
MAPTLLIVDDSKLARIVAAKAVAALQPEWRRAEAGNAAEALERIGGGGVDVVLVDYNMPERNGLELAAEIRARHPAMPVALLTANVQDEIIAQARALKLAFVPKPATEEGLRGFLAAAALRLRQGAA